MHDTFLKSHQDEIRSLFLSLQTLIHINFNVRSNSTDSNQPRDGSLNKHKSGEDDIIGSRSKEMPNVALACSAGFSFAGIVD